jgi:hypothetical protein
MPQIFVIILWVLILAVCISWYLVMPAYFLQKGGMSLLAGHILFTHWMGLNVFSTTSWHAK